MGLTAIRTGRRVWALLDLDVQGRVLRFTDSPEPLSVSTEAGIEYTYVPGLLPVPFARAAGALGSDEAVTIDAAVEVPWARMVARGHSLERAAVTIRRWIEGQTLDAAETWVRGKAAGVGYGGVFEPLTLTVVRPSYGTGVWPPTPARIDATTWPVTVSATIITDAAAIGAVYPVIFGTPTDYIIPAYAVEYEAANRTLAWQLFADGWVEATSCSLMEVASGAVETRTIRKVRDLLGRRVSYVDNTGGTYTIEPNREHRVALNLGTGGGTIGRGTTALAGAGEILEYLLRKTQVDVDWGRFAVVQQRLDAYKLDFVITKQIDVWAWIQNQIFPLLPMDWVFGAAGGYPDVWRLDATAEDATRHIDATAETGRYERTSAVTMSGGPIFNAFSIAYGVGGAQGRPARMRSIGGDDDDPRNRPNAWCAASQALHGILPMPTFSTELVVRTDTADRILLERARRYAISRRGFSIAGDETLDEVEVGEVILVSATDAEIDEEVAQVRNKRAVGDHVEITVLLMDDPLTRTRPVIP